MGNSKTYFYGNRVSLTEADDLGRWVIWKV